MQNENLSDIKPVEQILFIELFRLFKGRETSIVLLDRDIDKELDGIVDLAFNKDSIDRRYGLKSFSECKSIIQGIPDIVAIVDRLEVLANDPTIVDSLIQVATYLKENLPINSVQTLFATDVKEPNLFDKMDYVRTFECLVYPIESFRNVVANECTHKQIDIIGQFYPMLLDLLKEKIYNKALEHKKLLTRQQNMHLSQMLQVPRVNPDTLNAIHSSLMDKDQGDQKQGKSINPENMLETTIQNISSKGV